MVKNGPFSPRFWVLKDSPRIAMGFALLGLLIGAAVGHLVTIASLIWLAGFAIDSQSWIDQIVERMSGTWWGSAVRLISFHLQLPQPLLCSVTLDTCFGGCKGHGWLVLVIALFISWGCIIGAICWRFERRQSNRDQLELEDLSPTQQVLPIEALAKAPYPMIP